MERYDAKMDIRGDGFTPDPLQLDHDAEMVLNMDASYKDRYEEACANLVEEQTARSRIHYFEEQPEQVQDCWRYQVLRREDDQGTSVFSRLLAYEGDEACICVPEQLGGYPVAEVGVRAFASCKSLRSITLPNTVLRVGKKAFALDFKLEEVIFSDAIQELDFSVFEHCRALVHLHLPAALRELPDKILWDSMALEQLELPPACRKVGLKACRFERVKQLTIHPGNTYIKSDGQCLYSADGKKLLCALSPVGRYKIAPGCVEVCDDAFKNMRSLRTIELPDTLERIGRRAFSRTGIMRLELPASIRTVGDLAFSQCTMLTAANFPEGLRKLGSLAFEGTKLSKALLPATMEHIGSNVFKGTQIRFANKMSFGIAEGNTAIETDGSAIYSSAAGVKRLTGMLREVAKYRVAEGTEEVCDGAFAHQPDLANVDLPEGLHTIGAGAFEDCPKLSRINLPESLESIGDRAFFNSGKASLKFELGPRISHIGSVALATAGADYSSTTCCPSSISVHPDNPLFYVQDNMLCQRREGGDVLIAAAGQAMEMTIPARVSAIGDLAFAKVHVKDLHVHAGVTSVNVRAFLNIAGLERVHIAFPRAVDGCSQLTVAFPLEALSGRWYVRAMRMDTDGLFFSFDAYDSQVVQEVNVVDMTRLILERMDTPVKLTSHARMLFSNAIAAAMHHLSKQLMKKRDMKTFGRLADHGFIDGRNIDSLVEKAAAWHEAEATAYLMEMKNKRFRYVEEDFSF